MSFVERNKRWLLPVLGVPLAGVVWLNLPGGPPQAAPAQAPAAPQEPVPHADPAYAEDNETLPLLLAGRQPLSGDLMDARRSPALHPDQWTGLYQPRPNRDVPARPVPAGKLPRVDFLLETPTRLEAWIGGRAYREGDRLEGGQVLKRITPTGVVVSGPNGEVRIPLMKNGSPP